MESEWEPCNCCRMGRSGKLQHGKEDLEVMKGWKWRGRRVKARLSLASNEGLEIEEAKCKVEVGAEKRSVRGQV